MIRLGLLCFCHLSREEHAPCHQGSQNEEMHACGWARSKSRPRATSCQSQQPLAEPPWTTRVMSKDWLFAVAGLWASWLFIKQRYAVESWRVWFLLHGHVFCVLQTSVKLMPSERLILAVLLGTKGQIQPWSDAAWCGCSICPRKPNKENRDECGKVPEASRIRCFAEGQ